MLDYSLDAMSGRERKSVLSRGEADLTAAMNQVRGIIESVKVGGDASLRKFAEEYDGYGGESLSISRNEIRLSVRMVPKEVLEALTISRRRIEAFHSRQALESFEFKDEVGTFGQKVVPLDRVGVYVPGGTASYMSSVLMACIPARVAGVKEIAVCTPVKGTKAPSEILAAAEMCGVSEIHPVGGAHAIAALAYGTESIPRVQKIVGPGGAFVSAAKLLVRNDCEIDFLAGPSEVLVIADSTADPEMVSQDMLAQLEHDPLARAVLVTTSERVAEESKGRLEKLILGTSRAGIASRAAENGAVFILADSMDRAVEFSNEYAPEHLLIDARKPEAIMDKVTSAGSVFLGRHSSVVFGDYCSGTNHILPTKGVASMKSCLSVYDFLKVIPYQKISEVGAAKLSKVAGILARAEGLPAHADAALARVAEKVRR
jgi:histidinol dehydrogenase